jgi:hypothetical protein
MEGEPCFILLVGAGGRAVLYPPCWSSSESLAVSSLLEDQ